MKRLAGCILLAAGVFSLALGAALAEEPAKNRQYVEERGGLDGTAGPDTRGGAVGYRLRDGLALEAEGVGYGQEATKGRRTVRGQDPGAATPEAVGVTGMARVRVAGTDKAAVQVGVGGGGIVADKPATGSGVRQGAASQADIGTSLGLSRNVSLKATGRYQRQNEFSDRGKENLGANLGLRISF